MPNPPPRKRFQIHLSTAIVMMFVAGALIWANTAPRVVTVGAVFGETRVIPGGVDSLSGSVTDFGEKMSEADFLKAKSDYKGWIGMRKSIYGWPFDIVHSHLNVEYDEKPQVTETWPFDGVHSDLNVHEKHQVTEWLPPEQFRKEWHTGAFCINALVLCLILLATWFLCEWLIRRRAAQKEG